MNKQMLSVQQNVTLSLSCEHTKLLSTVDYSIPMTTATLAFTNY